MLADAIDLSRVRRVLVTKLRHHGDVLLTAPVFGAIRAAAPHAEVDALVYRETADLLRFNPAIATVHTIDRAWKSAGVLAQVRGEAALLSALRARRFDLLVHLTDHPRGAWLARLLGVRYAVAARRADAPRWWRSSFTHHYPLPRGRPRHTVETNLDALRRLGVQPAEPDRRVVLVPGEPAQARARALLAAHALEPGRFVHLHPASRWFFKCWPARRNADLVAALAQRGQRIVITAAPDERERAFVREILAGLGEDVRARVVDLSGELSLLELAALTAGAGIFVGVDSAPMHIAAAMGTPVVALFGPSGELEWGPWQVAQRTLVSDHPCRPCGNDGCGGGKVSECLSAIGVGRVLAAIDELGANRPSRTLVP
jgi:heptosyltransferase III